MKSLRDALRLGETAYYRCVGTCALRSEVVVPVAVLFYVSYESLSVIYVRRVLLLSSRVSLSSLFELWSCSCRSYVSQLSFAV